MNPADPTHQFVLVLAVLLIAVNIGVAIAAAVRHFEPNPTQVVVIGFAALLLGLKGEPFWDSALPWLLLGLSISTTAIGFAVFLHDTAKRRENPSGIDTTRRNADGSIDHSTAR